MSRLRAGGWALALALGLPAQAVTFAEDVQPILQKACYGCHRGPYTDANGRVRKPKGDLRLDGKGWIVKGGKEGTVLTPGNALQSPMFTRTVLPLDHDDHMPATGDPLTKAETEVLRRWIDAGADFGAWLGEAGPGVTDSVIVDRNDAHKVPAVSGTRLKDVARVAEGLAPLPLAVIAKAAGEKAQIAPLWQGCPLLRVEFPGHEDQVGDAEVAGLSPLQQHIGVLVLARTGVTDAACTLIARMPRLVRLDLRDTKVSDSGVARLRALPELVVLNLFATAVTDASLESLGAMPRLGELRLWQTKVSPDAVARLRRDRPALDVTLAPDLPEPAPPGEGQRGRRRR